MKSLLSKIIIILLSWVAFSCISPLNMNAQIWKGTGIAYTRSAPSHNPGMTGSWVAIDSISGDWYEWDQAATTWRQMGDRVQFTGTHGVPNYTPTKQRSSVAVNLGDSLYAWQGSWVLLNPEAGASYNASMSWANDTLSLTDDGGTLKTRIPAGYNSSFTTSNDTIRVADGGGTLFVKSPPPLAGTNIEVNGRTVSLDTLGLITFKDTLPRPLNTGQLAWNSTDQTLDIKLNNNVTLQTGQEFLVKVVNKSGVNLTQAAYQCVYAAEAQGQRIAVKLADADFKETAKSVIGLATENITTNNEGFITLQGLVRGINTTGSLQGQTWNDGDVLYLDTVAGGLTNVLRPAPNHKVRVGYVAYAHANNGMIFVKPESGTDLEEICNVKLTSPTNGQVLVYNATDSVWYNEGLRIDTFQVVSDTLLASISGDGLPASRVALGTYRQTIDTFSRSGRTVSLSLSGDNQPAQTITLAADSTTILTQDSILSYRAGGVEYARDTISVPGGGASLSGGVADYLTQWTSATTVDTAGIIWTGGRLGVRTAAPAATLEVMGSGSTSATSSLLVDNSAGRALLQVKDDGAIEVGRNATGTTQATASVTVTGSETNIGLALVPKGTGAITAQIPDGTITGGNARGTYAVDLQMQRASSNQVASGDFSFVGGGWRNRASSAYNVACGGNLNTSSGAISFTGGGQLNSATASVAVVVGGDSNSASGAKSCVLGGLSNTASGIESSISGGNSNAASGEGSCISGGRQNLATGLYSTVSGGSSNNATGERSIVTGGFAGSAYLWSHRAVASGNFAARGDAQTSDIRLRCSITGTAITELTLDGTTPSATSRAILPLPTGATAGRIWNAKIQVVAVCTVQGAGTVTVGEVYGGNYSAIIKRIGNSTSIVGAGVISAGESYDTNMETSVVTISADDTNESLKIEFTPPTTAAADTVIRVVATVYLTEVGY